MTTIPVDIDTPGVLQMFLGTMVAVVREELDRVPDFENINDSVCAELLRMALHGKDVDDMRAYLRTQPEWIQKHTPPPASPPAPDHQPPADVRPAIHGRLRVQGPRLFDEAGPWRWKIVTAFDAQRLALRGGWDQLREYAAWTRAVGGNGWRVFLNWQVSGLDFRTEAAYFLALMQLCEFTRGQGLRLLGTAICDQIPGGVSAQQAFLDQAFSVMVKDYDHTLGECANEPYNGNSELPSLFRRTSAWGELLVARGMCRPNAAPDPNDPHSTPYLPSLGFTTYQNGRDADWFRKVGKDGFEIRNGFDPFAGTHDACINNETMGAAETMQPGRRSNRVFEFLAAGGGAGLFTSGVTGHGDGPTMQRCVVPGPNESACIRALFEALDFVPVDAPTWTYTRYGPGHPAEPMPVVLDRRDSDETSRMHAMVGPSQAVVVNYNAALAGHEDWIAEPANGWRVVEQLGPVALCER